MTIITRAQTEIEELHQFFTDWYNGKLQDTDADFDRCASVLAPGFHMVSPKTGQMVGREPLLAGLRRANHAQPGMKIWIENVVIQHHFGGLVLATYEEWQDYQSKTTTRLSTVLFEEATPAPNGLRWLHVHETWISK